jgi:transposase-like protein
MLPNVMRFAENRMDTHKNARLTPKGREEMVRVVVEGGFSKAETARKYNTTPKTVAKWVERFRRDGVDGLRDRSSRPLSSPNQAAQATCAAVEALRRQRYSGGQIERFIQTSLREWAYAQAYENSRQRKQHLPAWLHRYN